MVTTSGIWSPYPSVEAEARKEQAGRSTARLDGHVERAGDVQVGRQQVTDLGDVVLARFVSASGGAIEVRQPGRGGLKRRVAEVPVLVPGPVQDHHPDRGR